MHAFLAQFGFINLGSRLDACFDPVNFPVQFMVLVGQLGKMCVAYFEIVQLLCLVRKFFGEFVWDVGHDISCCKYSLWPHTRGVALTIAALFGMKRFAQNVFVATNDVVARSNDQRVRVSDDLLVLASIG